MDFNHINNDKEAIYFKIRFKASGRFACYFDLNNLADDPGNNTEIEIHNNTEIETHKFAGYIDFHSQDCYNYKDRILNYIETIHEQYRNIFLPIPELEIISYDQNYQLINIANASTV